MRPYILILLIVMFLAVSLSGQDGITVKRKTDREDRGFIGPVHTVTIESWYIGDFDGTYHGSGGSGWPQAETTYNRAGNMVGRIEYDDEHQIKKTVICEIDSTGNEVKETELDPYDHAYTTLADYDRDGNLIEDKRVREDGTIGSWTKYTVDKHGRITTQTELSSEGNILETEDRSYDGNGRLLMQTGHRLNEKDNYQFVYTYTNEEGVEKKESQFFDYKGTLIIRTVLLTDKSGDITYLTYDGAGNLYRKFTRKYVERDSHGNWTIEIYTGWDPKKLIPLGKYFTRQMLTYY